MTGKPILVLFIAAALLLTACQQTAAPDDKTQRDVFAIAPQTAGELIHNPDLFLSNFSSMNTSVLGLRVGATENEVLEKLGTPDHVDEFNFGAIRNLHYGRSFGVNGTAVLYHIEHGFVTRIVVGPAMNPFLGFTTAVNKTRADIYGLHGTPDRLYDIPSGRFFVYNKQGFEVYLGKGGREYQYAFVYPNRKLSTTAVFNKTKNQYEVLQNELPKLLTDTTTLCDQGRTFGFSHATGQCKAFNNSCEIPDHWVEVERCETTAVNGKVTNNSTVTDTGSGDNQ